MTWHTTPAAQALIRALFALDGISASLEQHRSEILATGEDPVSMIGTVRQKTASLGLAHGYGRRWVTTGASACEACLCALESLRLNWIQQQAGVKFSEATQEQTNQLLAFDDETPTAGDAINAYVQCGAQQAWEDAA